MAANDKERSKVIIIDPNAKTEELKRPNHPDFMYPSELKEKEWSGMRVDPITKDMQMWVLGEVVFFVTAATVILDPNKFKNMYVEFFGIMPDFDPVTGQVK